MTRHRQTRETPNTIEIPRAVATEYEVGILRRQRDQAMSDVDWWRGKCAERNNALAEALGVPPGTMSFTGLLEQVRRLSGRPRPEAELLAQFAEVEESVRYTDPMEGSDE